MRWESWGHWSDWHLCSHFLLEENSPKIDTLRKKYQHSFCEKKHTSNKTSRATGNQPTRTLSMWETILVSTPQKSHIDVHLFLLPSPPLAARRVVLRGHWAPRHNQLGSRIIVHNVYGNPNHCKTIQSSRPELQLHQSGVPLCFRPSFECILCGFVLKLLQSYAE